MMMIGGKHLQEGFPVQPVAKQSRLADGQLSHSISPGEEEEEEDDDGGDDGDDDGDDGQCPVCQRCIARKHDLRTHIAACKKQLAARSQVAVKQS